MLDFRTRLRDILESIAPEIQGPRITAVNENRVVAVEPDGILSVAGTRFVEGIGMLAALLYPDLFDSRPQSYKTSSPVSTEIL